MKRVSTPQEDLFKSGACQSLSRVSRSWGPIEADQVRRTGLDREETALTSSRHIFVLNLRGSSDHGQYFLNGKSTTFMRRRPGSLLFMPAGHSWTGWEAGASSAAYLAIQVEPALVADLLVSRTKSRNLALMPELACEDLVLTNAARGIAAEMQEQSPLGTLLVENYVTIMFAQLLRLQQCVSEAPKLGGLPPAKLARVIAKIDEDLEAELSLSKLANLTGFSVPHFCRAFKQSVGVAPYTFILRRRIERAKEFLRHSEMPVTDIALACGFSSSSHFANVFRRETGISPAAFRAL